MIRKKAARVRLDAGRSSLWNRRLLSLCLSPPANPSEDADEASTEQYYRIWLGYHRADRCTVCEVVHDPLDAGPNDLNSIDISAIAGCKELGNIRCSENE